jgi:hypothetical protein
MNAWSDIAEHVEVNLQQWVALASLLITYHSEVG